MYFKLFTIFVIIYKYSLQLISTTLNLENLKRYDAFEDAGERVQDGGLVHTRIRQRNGRKTITSVQGLSTEYDLNKIVCTCKKKFACNGTIKCCEDGGQVLQLQGDQRENICQLLNEAGPNQSARLLSLLN